MSLKESPSIRGKKISDFTKNSTYNLLNVYADINSQRLIDECPGDVLQAISIL